MKIPERPEGDHKAVAVFLVPTGEGAHVPSFDREAKCEVGCKMQGDVLYIFHFIRQRIYERNFLASSSLQSSDPAKN